MQSKHFGWDSIVSQIITIKMAEHCIKEVKIINFVPPRIFLLSFPIFWTMKVNIVEINKHDPAKCRHWNVKMMKMKYVK